MKTIVFNVADETAKKWEGLPEDLKHQLQQRFENQMNVFSKSMNDAAFKALLDKISDEAKKNGLTEEILQEILKDE